jgi:hypothetical protein
MNIEICDYNVNLDSLKKLEALGYKIVKIRIKK